MRFFSNFNPSVDNNDKLLFNNLITDVKPPEKNSTLHQKIKYELNTQGYRSPEFIENVEIMALGCSFTYGSGLDQEMTWPFILSKKSNKNFINLALPGDSAAGQIRKAFSYFENYGNPQIIVAMFPLYRMEMPTVPNKFFKKRDRNLNKIEHYVFYDDWFESYSKAPHDPESVIPKEAAIFYTQYHIQILEQYCRTNNIKLIWSVWENYEEIYNFLNKTRPGFLKNYCEIEWDMFFDYKAGHYNKKEISCEVHKDNSENKLFHRAADRENEDFCHLGWHFHMHVAEAFYDKI